MLGYFIIGALILYKIYSVVFNTEKKAIGNAGEAEIIRELRKEIPRARVFQSVYVDIPSGKTEVDIVALDKSGIYVIESKNYNGKIEGDIGLKFWRYSHVGGKQFTFYNPIWQNRTHVNAIKYQLKLKQSQLVSYVVFGKKSEIRKIKGQTDVRVMGVRKVRECIKHDMAGRGRVFTDQELKEMEKWFKGGTKVNILEKMRHVISVKRKAA